MVPWGLVTFLVGIAYGFFAAGKQDKSRLFLNGLLIGFIIAVVLALVGFLTDAPALGFGGVLGILWTALILALLFIIGVWIGDLIEGSKSKPRSRRS